MRTLSYYEYCVLPEVERKKLFDSFCAGKRMQGDKYNKYTKENRLSKPGVLPVLYCITPFPVFSSPDGLFYIRVNDGNAFNGGLALMGSSVVLMNWFGYASALIDGQLFLTKVTSVAMIIGLINGVLVKYNGTQLVQGDWPEFLVLFE